MADTARDLRFQITYDSRCLASTFLWSFAIKRTNLLYLGFNACSRVAGRCIQKVLRRYSSGNIEDLSECKEITNADVLALVGL